MNASGQDPIGFLLPEAGDGVKVALVKADLLVVRHRLLDEVLHVGLQVVDRIYNSATDGVNL